MPNCESQEGWEKVAKRFREVCLEALEQHSSKIKAGNFVVTDLHHLGNIMNMAFDLEQASKVFADNTEQAKFNMNHVKHQCEEEKKQTKSIGHFGFVDRSVSKPVLDFDETDEDEEDPFEEYD